jgi:hypothetical protein
MAAVLGSRLEGGNDDFYSRALQPLQCKDLSSNAAGLVLQERSLCQEISHQVDLAVVSNRVQVRITLEAWRTESGCSDSRNLLSGQDGGWQSHQLVVITLAACKTLSFRLNEVIAQAERHRRSTSWPAACSLSKSQHNLHFDFDTSEVCTVVAYPCFNDPFSLSTMLGLCEDPGGRRQVLMGIEPGTQDHLLKPASALADSAVVFDLLFTLWQLLSSKSSSIFGNIH